MSKSRPPSNRLSSGPVQPATIDIAVVHIGEVELVGQRVLQVITDPGRRGAQVFAIDLGLALAGVGHDVRTVALSPTAADVQLDVPVLGQGGRWAFLPPLRRLMRAADVVVAHGSRTLIGTALGGLGLGTPVVYRQISDLTFWADTPARQRRVGWSLGQMTHVVALWDGSAAVLEDSFGVPAAKITVIPNAVREDAFRPPNEPERAAARQIFDLPVAGDVITYVGALVPEKGVDLLIRAMVEIPGTLLVVGDGRELPSLRGLAVSLLGDRLRFATSVEDVRSVYWASDLLVLASRGGDSMPAVLAEAGLCGLPALATRVDGIVRMVIDGKTGYFIEPEVSSIVVNAAKALAQKHTLGAQARVFALKEFAMSSVVDAWSQVLTSSGQPAETSQDTRSARP